MICALIGPFALVFLLVTTPRGVLDDSPKRRGDHWGLGRRTGRHGGGPGEDVDAGYGSVWVASQDL